MESQEVVIKLQSPETTEEKTVESEMPVVAAVLENHEEKLSENEDGILWLKKENETLHQRLAEMEQQLMEYKVMTEQAATVAIAAAQTVESQSTESPSLTPAQLEETPPVETPKNAEDAQKVQQTPKEKIQSSSPRKLGRKIL